MKRSLSIRLTRRLIITLIYLAILISPYIVNMAGNGISIIAPADGATRGQWWCIVIMEGTFGLAYSDHGGGSPLFPNHSLDLNLGLLRFQLIGATPLGHSYHFNQTNNWKQAVLLYPHFINVLLLGAPAIAWVGLGVLRARAEQRRVVAKSEPVITMRLSPPKQGNPPPP